MGEIDIRAKQFFGHPEVFADICNFLEYNGAEVYLPGMIQPLSSTEMIPPAKELQRDLIRRIVLP